MTNSRGYQKFCQKINPLLMTTVFLMVATLYVMVLMQSRPNPIYEPVARELPENISELDSKTHGTKTSLLTVPSCSDLSSLFETASYTLSRKNERAQQEVPQLYLAKLPKDYSRSMSVKERQEIFMQTLLPLILDANHEVLRERTYLEKLKSQTEAGMPLTEEQNTWLIDLGKKYKSPGNVKLLLKRVDIIPPSLALAQAIEETGWGMSHAARNKNSTFGVTLKSGVKAYDTLYASVRAYVLNLNVNPAYSDMRQIRHELRQDGEDLCSEKLMRGLHRYSELRNAYVKKIHGIIKKYDLKRFDSAQLRTL